jgi:hypothetical protein
MISNSQVQSSFCVSQQFGNRSRWGIFIGIAFLGVVSASAQAAVFTVNSPSDVVDANPGNGI